MWIVKKERKEKEEKKKVKEERAILLDSSAILSGKSFSGELFTSPSIMEEFSPGGRSWRSVQFLKSAGMRILSPSHYYLKKIREAAKRTGDDGRLSKADEEILALALELNADRESLLLTDDYSIQNVAKEVGIPYSSIIQEGIKEKFRWRYRCEGCGRFFEGNKDKDKRKEKRKCPICGSELKKVRSR